MTAAREIYWISSNATAILHEKIDILKKLKVEVKVLPDFIALARTYPNARLNTIIIDDEIIGGKASEQLGKLSSHPEYAGVRFILSINSSSREATQRAVSLGFRDVIPLDLNNDQWLRRYSFAASGQAADMAEPYPQITMKTISALHIPARIAWINETELWLESRLTPPVGTHLTLGGGIADSIGVKHLTLKVKEHHDTHLHFRYSDALLCRWDIPKAHQEKKNILREFFKTQPKIAPLRVYTIIRSLELRKDLLHRLNAQRFQVAIALNKTNMIHEPRYIGPDVIVIEDRMCMGSNRVAFKEMLDNLITDIPILIIGPNVNEDKFTDISRSVRILRSHKLPANLEEYLIEQAGKTEDTRASVTFVPKNHSMSFAHVAIPARITRLHPDAAQLALNFPLGRFGICGLEAPLFHSTLGRSVFFKVTECYGHNQASLKEFPYKVEGLLIDLQQQERRLLKDHLTDYYSQKIEESLHPQQRKAELVEPELSREKVPAPQAAEHAPIKDDVSEVLSSTKIEINPSAEEYLSDSKIDRAVEGWSKIRLEWKVAALTILLFGLLYIMIIFMRSSQEEQGGFMTEQLRIFQEQHSGGKKPQ